jgi:hypothetical protein
MAEYAALVLTAAGQYQQIGGTDTLVVPGLKVTGGVVRADTADLMLAAGSGSNNVRLRPLGSASATGQFVVASDGSATADGDVVASQNFKSSTTTVVLAPSAAGNVRFRPQGAGSSTNETVISSTGDLTCGNDIIATGNNVKSGINFISTTSNAVFACTGAGTVFLRPNGGGSVTGQLSVASTGAVTINGTLTTSGNSVTGKTETAGDNSTKLASTAYVRAAAPNNSYRNLIERECSHTAGKVTGTYAIGSGDPAAVSGTGTLNPQGVFYYDPADHPTIDGLAPKLRIRCQVYVNDTAPTATFQVGLYPVTRPATSGGAGVCIYTLGTVVSGSQATAITTPAVDTSNQSVGSDFAAPTAGYYVLGFVQTTATVAASSHLHIAAQLQMRNN